MSSFAGQEIPKFCIYFFLKKSLIRFCSGISPGDGVRFFLLLAEMLRGQKARSDPPLPARTPVIKMGAATANRAP